MNATRHEVTFSSGAETCAGWLFLPDSATPAPGIAMAHGFAAVKEQHLEQFALRFQQAGFGVLLFDYRHVGASTGLPRGHASPHSQQEDFRNAVTWPRVRPEIDPDKIGLWGTSYGGGHVMQVAAFDRRVQAVVANVPIVDVWRNFLRMHSAEEIEALRGLLRADRERRYTTGISATVPITAPAGHLSVLGPAYLERHQRWHEIGPRWINEMTIESSSRTWNSTPAPTSS